LALLSGMRKAAELKKKVEDLEKREILRALEEEGWVRFRAAKKLGITERMFNYRLRKYGMQIQKRVVMGDEESLGRDFRE